MKNIIFSLLILSPLLAPSSIANGANPEYQSFGKFDLGKTAKLVQDVKKAVTELTEPEEIELGENISSNLLGMAPLLADQDVQRYVNSVGRWVSTHSDRPDLPWTFAVLDNSGLNAFAAPGGYIFITKGLLLKMKNEAELAGVLGHEIVHVTRKHHLKANQEENRLAALKGGVSMYQEYKNKDTKVLNLIAGAFTQIYARGLNKEDEFESDRMGVVLAARAGYDPFGLPAVLQSLQIVNPSDQGIGLLLSTHPKLSDRLDLLDKVIGSSFDKYDNQPNGEARFNKVIAKLNPNKK